MVVTHPISSLSPKMRNPTGQRIKRLSVTPLARPEPEHSSEYHLLYFGDVTVFVFKIYHPLTLDLVVETGPVMGLVFAAFVMGVGLMGGLWFIYNYTGNKGSLCVLCMLSSYQVSFKYRFIHQLIPDYSMKVYERNSSTGNHIFSYFHLFISDISSNRIIIVFPDDQNLKHIYCACIVHLCTSRISHFQFEGTEIKAYQSVDVFTLLETSKLS